MNWGSLDNFITMGGHGLYVWGSVIVSFALLIGEVIVLRTQRTNLLKQVALWVRSNRGRTQ
jgi:heme exporter protein D